MTEYEVLFREYVQALRDSRETATEWWNGLVAAEIVKAGSASAAMDRLQERWPFGPVSHPTVLGVYRTYFLRCEALNSGQGSSREDGDQPPADEEWGQSEVGGGDFEGPIDGWVLLVDMLWGRHDDLAEFVQGMVLKPIGTDPDTAEFI